MPRFQSKILCHVKNQEHLKLNEQRIQQKPTPDDTNAGII